MSRKLNFVLVKNCTSKDQGKDSNHSAHPQRPLGLGYGDRRLIDDKEEEEEEGGEAWPSSGNAVGEDEKEGGGILKRRSRGPIASLSVGATRR